MSFIDDIEVTRPTPPRGNPSATFSNEVDTGRSEPSRPLSFINEIDTEQEVGFGDYVNDAYRDARNRVTNFLDPTNLRDIVSDNANKFIERSVDSLGRSVKEVISEEIARTATSPIKDAINRAAGGLLGDLFEGFMDEQENVPPQYSGTVNEEIQPEDMFHSDRYALSKYNLGESSDAYNDSHPMMKYMFVADFVFNTDEYYTSNMMQLVPTSLTLSLKNTTFPKMELESEEVNQYNRHVQSSKRVRYQPITATFGESVSHMVGGQTKGSMIEVWNKIASYYITDFNNPDADFTNSPLGHRSGNSHNKLIKYIDLYFIWPTSTKRIRIVNPYITSFSYDNLDYGSDEQVLATFDIKYEYYQLRQVQGSFADFINSPAGASLIPGSPYELVDAGTTRNIDVIQDNADGTPDLGDIDDQRMTNLDNDYADAIIQLAEQEAIQAASSLLGSNDPVKRELGRQAVERALDAGQSLAEATGVFTEVGETVENIGRELGGVAREAISGVTSSLSNTIRNGTNSSRPTQTSTRTTPSGRAEVTNNAPNNSNLYDNVQTSATVEANNVYIEGLF